jgi:O6-methylguanine-DNA--protein-cysteine methyltransferase
VGTAVSQNPIGIFIPCHRILPKHIFESNINNNDDNGFVEVGQYMNGVDIKRFLLNLEYKLVRINHE